MTYEEMTLNINLTLDECIAQCEALGLKVGNIKSIELNSRYKTAAGKCLRKKLGTDYHFIINIAIFTMSQSQEFITDTIMHEVLHTLPGCFNHSPKWQAAARKVNTAYGYNISTKYKNDELTDTAHIEARPYEIKCTGCGATGTKTRATGITKDPSGYRCKRCNGLGTFEVRHKGVLIAGPTVKENKTKVVVATNKTQDKYTVTCLNCNITRGYSRAGKVINNITHYNCNCGGKLKVVQNY